MGKTVVVRTEDHTIELKVDTYPDTCPLCHKGIDPRFYDGFLSINHLEIEAAFQCPLLACQHLFIGYYQGFHIKGNSVLLYYLNHLEPVHYEPHGMSDIINSVSIDFVKIFNQAEQAETLNLLEIAGPGYRKSLEFLIKDYVISKKPDKKEEIKKSHLGTVISSYIDDSRIQATAKRAAWLGNDETHYYRKWEDKDIKDLKILIRLTVGWIESVQLTEEYEKSMSDDKK
jgi:hypothetical protein